MGDLREMIRYENANSALAFRDRSYGDADTSELLRDVLSLANADVAGPRFLVLGVRDAVGGDRQVIGIERVEIARLQKSIALVAARCIEPPIKISVRGCEIDAVSIAIVTIQRCDDPPYLLKLDVSETDHVGRGWIRRGTAAHPLIRADLQRMLAGRASSLAMPISVEIGFPGKLPRDEISLPALPLDEMPSKVAAHRLQRMLEGKQSVRDLLGRTETRLSRLMHAQLYGNDVAFEKHSDESLRKRLAHVTQEHKLADEHYEFEHRAHELQLVVRNCSDVAIDNAMLELKILRIDGMGLAERAVAAAATHGAASGAPTIDADATRYSLQTEIGRIPKRSTVPVFRQPPRLWIRESACGRTILLEYRFHCRQSHQPTTGALRLHVDAAPTIQADGRSAPAR